MESAATITSWRRFPSALPIQNSMIKQPTIPSFLLRSRAFWLTMVTLLFFSWAWRDSTQYRSQLFYNLSGKSGIYIASQECGVSVGKVDFNPVAKFVFFMIRDEQYQRKSQPSLIKFSPLYIHYSTLMIFTIALSIIWNLWRWHRMKKACVVDAGLGRDG